VRQFPAKVLRQEWLSAPFSFGKGRLTGSEEIAMSAMIHTAKSKAAPSVTSPPKAPAIVHHATASGGQALDAQTQRQMGSRFGHDFSRVRIHTDSAASSSAHALRSQAYTVGEDIVFRDGKFSPHSRDGERLLAHELTHVVQQSQARGGTWERVSRSGDESEREAERLAGDVLSGRQVQVSAVPGTAVQAYLATDPDSLPSLGDVAGRVGGGIADAGSFLGGNIGGLGSMIGSSVSNTGGIIGGGVSALGGLFGEGSVGEGVGSIAGGAISGIGALLGGGISGKAAGVGSDVSGFASGLGSQVAGFGADFDPSQLLM